MSPTELIHSGPHKPKLFSFESAVAMYHEGGTFAVVRISDITLTDSGIKATATVIPTPGFPPAARESWSFSASWSSFSLGNTSWYAHNINWGLEFDPAKIKLMSAKILAIPPDIFPGARNGIIRAIMSGNYERADDYLRMATAEKKN